MCLSTTMFVMPCFQFRFVFLHEHIIEIVHVPEVLQLILGGFTKYSLIHHVDDDIPKIYCCRYTPVLENHLGHGTVFFQGKVLDTIEQLLPGDVSGSVQPFPGMLQGFEHEDICIGFIARVGTRYLFEFT